LMVHLTLGIELELCIEQHLELEQSLLDLSW
jgi:hypothetical protein